MTCRLTLHRWLEQTLAHCLSMRGAVEVIAVSQVYSFIVVFSVIHRIVKRFSQLVAVVSSTH